METQSLDSGARVQALIEITQSLNTIFERENDLLSSQRPLEIAPLQADKARLAAAYAQSIKDIAADRGLVENADSALLATLKDLTRKFEARAAEQRTLLGAARRASEGVVEAVAQEAAKATASTAYGQKDDERLAAPISLNEEA